MARHTISCSDQDHLSRRNQPGWAAELGHVDLPDGVTPTHQTKGYLCGACGRASSARPRKRQIPANRQLAVLARSLHALLAGGQPSQEDQDLIRELAS